MSCKCGIIRNFSVVGDPRQVFVDSIITSKSRKSGEESAMKRSISLFLFAMFSGMMVFNLVSAETIEEAVERQVKQAEIDYKKIPIFAITVEALRSGREFPGMPANVIEAARRIGDSATHVQVGKSEVTVKGTNDFVTFTIEPSAMSAPDAQGATQHAWRTDTIDYLIGWVRGARTAGIVFAKNEDEIIKVVPNFRTCFLSFILNSRHDERIMNACKRFGLGDVQTARVWKTDEDISSEREFLFYLMANYGVEGVLNRAALEKALVADMARVDALIKMSEEKTGYITYDPYSGAYQAKTGHVLLAEVYDSDSQIAPNGRVKMFIYVYSERVETVQVELQYADGSAVAKTALGNMAKASFTRSDMVNLEGSASDVNIDIVEIKLPPELKPGKFQIIGSAVDEKGNLIGRAAPIGTFEYAVK